MINTIIKKEKENTSPKKYMGKPYTCKGCGNTISSTQECPFCNK